MLKETFGIIRLYLPKYSPFLNPIEYAFNYLQNTVTSMPFSNRGELVDVIKKSIPTITPEKTKGFFHQTQKYHRQCLLGLPFKGKPLDPYIPSPVPQITYHSQ